MRALVQEWRTDPAIISQAVSVIYTTPPKDTLSEIDALHAFVRDSIRYTRDVHQVETLCTPLMTLTRRVGDCDDKATLLAALAESVGYPTRFVMGDCEGAGYSHVWVQLLSDEGWVDADATEAQPLGWTPECLATWTEPVGT